jgi:hypothetical protein
MRTQRYRRASLITDYPWSAPYEDVKLKPK